jgi:hypothetical protein
MKKIVNLEIVTTRGWKKIVNLKVVTTRGWKKIVNLEVVTTRIWKKIVNLEIVTTRIWKKIVNLEVVTTQIWKKIVKVVNFVVVQGLQELPIITDKYGISWVLGIKRFERHVGLWVLNCALLSFSFFFERAILIGPSANFLDHWALLQWNHLFEPPVAK